VQEVCWYTSNPELGDHGWMAANPFLAPSPLPFGYPDFSAIHEEHLLPAFVEGMARQRAEVDAIAADPAPPTFENTLVALERSGDVLRRVSAVFFVLAASSSTEGIRAVEAEVAPLLAAHADAIRLDPALFARIEAIAAEWGVGGDGASETEDRRLVERYHRDAVRAGARLGPAEQERLRAINAELSSLTTEFGNRLLAGAAAAAVHVTDPTQLDGLTPDALSAAARAARSRGLDGHLLTLVLPTEQPALAALTHRDLRERLHTASVTRGLGGPHDTRDTLLRIVRLRAARARLLGHPHHASWVVETGTAGSTEAVGTDLEEQAVNSSVEQVSDRLSELADSVLDVTIEAVWRQLPKRHRESPRFAVIAYGKLGGKELGYASDLDLIFLYDDPDEAAAEIYATFTRRLITWLTTATGAGTLFDVDLRLRPNGESGLLITDLDAFRRYQLREGDAANTAWVWEHQALTRARFCAGDAQIGAEFESIRKQVLTMPREAGPLATEIVAMRERVAAGHPNRSDLFDLKHDRGGMVDIEFIVQYWVLLHAARDPELILNTGNIALLREVARYGLMQPEEAETVGGAYRAYRKLQHRLRLDGMEKARVPAAQIAAERDAVLRLWQRVFG